MISNKRKEKQYEYFWTYELFRHVEKTLTVAHTNHIMHDCLVNTCCKVVFRKGAYNIFLYNMLKLNVKSRLYYKKKLNWKLEPMSFYCCLRTVFDRKATSLTFNFLIINHICFLHISITFNFFLNFDSVLGKSVVEIHLVIYY